MRLVPNREEASPFVPNREEASPFIPYMARNICSMGRVENICRVARVCRLCVDCV